MSDYFSVIFFFQFQVFVMVLLGLESMLSLFLFAVVSSHISGTLTDIV